MTQYIDLEALEHAPPQAQLAVLLHAVSNLRQTAIETTRIWMTVGGHGGELREFESEVIEAAEDHLEPALPARSP